MCVAAKPICKNCDLVILDICPLQFFTQKDLEEDAKAEFTEIHRYVLHLVGMGWVSYCFSPQQGPGWVG